ncbi:MAG: PilZ domain-containing protein [Gammaproteobacteria bacterium]|nr:PilZ domain-containing protein [Gammaproteobacteria bacterium]
MEQRWSTRTQVDLSVDISHMGETLADLHTHDIGLGGAFLQMDSKVLNNNDMVELTFSLSNNEQMTRHKIGARVVRTANGGVGFMFRDFDANAFRSLQEVLHFAHNAATNPQQESAVI